MTTQELWEKMVEDARKAIVSNSPRAPGPADPFNAQREAYDRFKATERQARAALLAALKVLSPPNDGPRLVSSFEAQVCDLIRLAENEKTPPT